MDDSNTPLHVCTSSLPIDMNGDNVPDTGSSAKKSYDPTDVSIFQMTSPYGPCFIFCLKSEALQVLRKIGLLR